MINLDTSYLGEIDLKSRLNPEILEKIGFREDKEHVNGFYMGDIQIVRHVDITRNVFYAESHLQSWGTGSEYWDGSQLYTLEDLAKYFGNKLKIISEKNKL